MSGYVNFIKYRSESCNKKVVNSLPIHTIFSFFIRIKRRSGCDEPLNEQRFHSLFKEVAWKIRKAYSISLGSGKTRL